MKRKLAIIGLVVLALGLLGVGAHAEEIDSDYPATVDPYEEIDVGLDFSDTGTTVDVFVNDSSGNIVQEATVSDDGTSTINETFDVVPGDYQITTDATDAGNVTTTIATQPNNLIEEREIVVSDTANETIAADATVSGSANVSIQTVIEYNGEILSSETNTYDGSGATEILSATYDPPENGTYIVRQEVVNGDETIVNSVYFDTIKSDTGAVATTDDGFVAGMSSLELAGVLGVALILLLVLFGGRD